MKRPGVRVLIPVLMGLLAAGSIFMARDYVMARPSRRTKAYFLIYRTWYSHCPFAAGKVWPYALARFFKPFVPVWVQVEPGVTRVDAVKIDVEGAEFLVLKGAAETLDRYRPVLSVELSETGLNSMGSSVKEVMAFMRFHRYALKQTTEANSIFVPVAAP